MSALASLNQSIFLWLHHFAGRWALLDGMAIFFAEWLPYILCIVFLILVLYQDGARRRLYLFAEGALAILLARGIIVTAIHFFYYHPRPFVVYNFAPLISESGSSFPSAHAAWFFALAMAVWYADRRWGWWFFSFALAMGIARIYAGVHFPLDVIGGAVIGVASGMGIHWLLAPALEELGRDTRI
jgi:undecaprenyl-diphosphatase